MRTLGTLAALFVAIGPGASSAAAPAHSEKLNVVLILADDLGAGDLGCYGHPRFKTPQLDGLARAGARLTQFNTPCPFCAPTRGALMTGRYPFRSGLTGNPFPATDDGARGNTSGERVGLATGEVTLADVFQKAGYRTGCFGKWHLGHQPEFRPLRRGFAEYFGILYSNDMHPVELFDGEQMIEYPVVQTTLMQRLTDRAVAFIEKHRDAPLLAYVPMVGVHKPLAPAEKFYRRSGAGLYGDAVAELDDCVGRILACLERNGLRERTLVIFSSDNGPWFGGSTGGLRGMKGRAYEGGHRVPLIVRWPGTVPAGHVSDEPAITMDLFTTILAAAGLALPADRVIDGRDLRPVLTGRGKSPHEALFYVRGAPLSAVRSGPWKLIIVPPGAPEDRVWSPQETWIDPRRPDGVRILAPYEQPHPSEYPGLLTGDKFSGQALFNLAEDPGEQHDVAAANPEVVARLRALCDRVQAEFPLTAPRKK